MNDKDFYELPNNVLNAVPNPVVTVRTLTFQHRSFIRDCIEGVLMQKTSFPIELLIGEDCSTDGTREIVSEYAKKYPNIIRVITAGCRVGIKANVLRCVALARGKYTAICEGDDYWIDPFKLQKQVDFLKENPGYGVVFTDADHLDHETGELIKAYDKTHKRKIPQGDVAKKILYMGPYKTCTSLFLKELEDNHCRDFANANLKVYDKSLWIYIAMHRKIGYLSDSTAVYRILNSSASHFALSKDAEKFYKAAYKVALFHSYKYNIPIKKAKLKRRYIQSVITHCILKKDFRFLAKFCAHPFLILKIMVKEKSAKVFFKK